MRIVKLNKTHRLFHRGFTHAFRFEGWSNNECTNIERLLEKKYGHSWPNSNFYWQTHWGHKSKKSGSRPYWIGVRNEAMVTQVLLSVN